MATSQDHESLNVGKGPSKHDPLINDSEVETRPSESPGRITLPQAKQQLDGVARTSPTGKNEVELDRPHQAFPWVDRARRNHPLDTDHQSVEQVAVNGTQYDVGLFVELRELVGSYAIEFVEIKSIHVHNATEHAVIRGLPYARTRNLGDCLPRKQSEVCLIMEIDIDDERVDEEKALLEIELEDILRKRILINTNKSFPHCRFDPVAYATTAQREEQAPLTCRWQMRAAYRNAQQRRAGILQSQMFEHFSERCRHKIKRRNLGFDKERSREWRGETIPGGSAVLEPDPINDDSIDNKTIRFQRYSFAEVSAGAGGASRGAEMAGFKVVLATESCPEACKSYRANFPNTELYQINPKKLDADGLQRTVDLLHISSSALIAANSNKDTAQRICSNALNKFHPRLISMEQNADILNYGNSALFKAIIRSFTEAGFSILWKIIDMVEYGLPQIRKRFIMIGAGPGEKLASWPTATHSLHQIGDQQPFFTEKEAISGLNPVLHSLHNPESLHMIDRAARDSEKPLEAMITINGSRYRHPCGRRQFTLRELACLQGFPTYHQFEGSSIKRQIGDAMPPSVAMAFYQQLRQHVEELDGITSDIIHLEEPAGDAPASLPEAVLHTRVAAGERDELPKGPSDEATMDAPPDILRNEQRSESLSPRQSQPAVSSPSPRHTMPPEAQQNAGPTSPIMQTPASAHIPSTPSTSGRFEAGSLAASLRRRRGRALIEESRSDRKDDHADPVASPTPSKRPRRSLPKHGTKASHSEETRMTLASSNNADGQAEDMPTSEDAGMLGFSGPDDEKIADLAREL